MIPQASIPQWAGQTVRTLAVSTGTVMDCFPLRGAVGSGIDRAENHRKTFCDLYPPMFRELRSGLFSRHPDWEKLMAFMAGLPFDDN
jgi:hypothetical protein